MITVDKSKLDRAIESLEGMFSNTEKVLIDYEAEREELENRGNDLNKRLAELQNKQTETLLLREKTKETAKYIKLSKDLANYQEESQIIVSLQEQLQADFRQLKQKYIPVIRDTYSKDSRVMRSLDVDYVVEDVRYELVKSIADFANAVRKEDSKVIGVIQDEFLSDSDLMQDNRGFQRTFDYDRTKLSYSSFMPNLLTRNNINYACGGSVDSEIRKPREVK
ncbi:hypothetical protein CUC15_03880 [Oceanobacillus zhaokaii]|uniref:Uncharacterized protein n=1 Tax=Oceanobacillus zhaokaii TaxID=2052660 RepID=A0A345PDS7_9BACI|nr:hypothetical protein [Oceanobacillus zhaokaii]AXI08157.1 hypothetical protein CUC15_03880 [Oceanobacillus zhaokaii]